MSKATRRPQHFDPETASRALELLRGELLDREVDLILSAGLGQASYHAFRACLIRKFAPLIHEVDRLEAMLEGIDRLGLADALATVVAKAAGRPLPDSPPALRPRLLPAAEVAAMTVMYRDGMQRIHPALWPSAAGRCRVGPMFDALRRAFRDGSSGAMSAVLDAAPGEVSGFVIGGDAGSILAVHGATIRFRKRLLEIEASTAARLGDPCYALFEDCRDEWQTGGEPLVGEVALLDRVCEELRSRLPGKHQGDPQSESSWQSVRVTYFQTDARSGREVFVGAAAAEQLAHRVAAVREAVRHLSVAPN